MTTPAGGAAAGGAAAAPALYGQSLLNSLDERGLSYEDRMKELTAISDLMITGSQVTYLTGKCPMCGGEEVEDDGMVLCGGCARVVGSAVDRASETRGFFDDSRRAPVERSDVPVNPLYPRSSMASTVHVDRRGNSTDYNSMRLAKRSGMASKERPRDAVFKIIDAVGFNNKLSPAVVASAKHFFSKVVDERTSRGDLKRGLVAACLYVSLEINDTYRPEDAVAAMFGVSRGQLIQGKKIIHSYIDLPVKPPTAAKQVLSLARNLGLSPAHMDMCKAVCERASSVDALVAYAPKSVAAGAIMLVCDAFGLRGRKDVMAAVGVSALTLTKIVTDLRAVEAVVFPRVEARLTVENPTSKGFPDPDCSGQSESDAVVRVTLTALW